MAFPERAVNGLMDHLPPEVHLFIRSSFVSRIPELARETCILFMEETIVDHSVGMNLKQRNGIAGKESSHPATVTTRNFLRSFTNLNEEGHRKWVSGFTKFVSVAFRVGQPSARSSRQV